MLQYRVLHRDVRNTLFTAQPFKDYVGLKRFFTPGKFPADYILSRCGCFGRFGRGFGKKLTSGREVIAREREGAQGRIEVPNKRITNWHSRVYLDSLQLEDVLARIYRYEKYD
jgi:hypothetical protein